MNLIKQHRTFFIVLLVGLALYFSLVGFWTGFFTKLKIQSYIKNKTGLNVEMGLTYVYPFTGNGYIKNISIRNPAGYASGRAFTIDEISFQGNHKTMYADTIQIESMRVKGIQIHFETRGASSNFHTLFMNASRFYKSDDSNHEEWFKRTYMRNLYIEPVNILLEPSNIKIVLDEISKDEVGTPEDGIAWNQFGLLLASRYKPALIQAMQDQASPLSGEVRNFVLQWLGNHVPSQ